MQKLCSSPSVQHHPLPQHDELQQHKERVTDKLQGLVTTIDKLPSILTAETAQVRVGGGGEKQKKQRCGGCRVCAMLAVICVSPSKPSDRTPRK